MTEQKSKTDEKIVAFAEVKRAAGEETPEEREKRLNRMAEEVKLREELRKPARVVHIVETQRQIREVRGFCMAEGDYARTMIAALSIRQRRGLLGRIFRRRITLDEIMAENKALTAMQQEYAKVQGERRRAAEIAARRETMSLGEKVKALREKKGMNQKQLSEASLITQATISRIESGKVNQLKSDALKRLADALGSTVDYLVDKADQLTPEDVMKADKTAKYLFRGYEKLSSDGRKQLIDFVQFLEGKEKTDRKDREGGE